MPSITPEHPLLRVEEVITGLNEAGFKLGLPLEAALDRVNGAYDVSEARRELLVAPFECNDISTLATFFEAVIEEAEGFPDDDSDWAFVRAYRLIESEVYEMYCLDYLSGAYAEDQYDHTEAVMRLYKAWKIEDETSEEGQY